MERNVKVGDVMRVKGADEQGTARSTATGKVLAKSFDLEVTHASNSGMVEGVELTKAHGYRMSAGMIVSRTVTLDGSFEIIRPAAQIITASAPVDDAEVELINKASAPVVPGFYWHTLANPGESKTLTSTIQLIKNGTTCQVAGYMSYRDGNWVAFGHVNNMSAIVSDNSWAGVAFDEAQAALVANVEANWSTFYPPLSEQIDPPVVTTPDVIDASECVSDFYSTAWMGAMRAPRGRLSKRGKTTRAMRRRTRG